MYKTYEKGIPQVNFIEPGKVFPNLRTFARVMTHLEPGKVQQSCSHSPFAIAFVLMKMVDAFLDTGFIFTFTLTV